METAAHILVVDDELVIRESLRGWLEEEGHRVDTAEGADEALKLVAQNEYGAAFLDIKMPGIDGIELLGRLRKMHPDMPVVMMTAYASVDNAVEAMKLGAYDYLMKPFDPEIVSIMVRKIIGMQTLHQENTRLKDQLESALKHVSIIGDSPAIAGVLAQVEEIAGSDASVLVHGESGTGKELVARAIHYASERRYEPFVPLSCGTLPEALVESELFGYERGAFTGAFYKKKGKFEAADGGTLFLDEIGELSPRMEVDLLRVLQEKEITRIGSNKTIDVDFRVIAATHRDLQQRVKDGEFREDLFYRLNVYRIEIPPLRDRLSDVPALASHFVARQKRRTGKAVEGLTEGAIGLLQQYHWPGNVRELENAVERAFVTTRGTHISGSDLHFLAPVAKGERRSGALTDVEREHIAQVLEECEYNISQTAKILGIDRTTLYSKMKKYGLERE